MMPPSPTLAADDRLVWLDLEMTGLDVTPSRDRRDRRARHRQRARAARRRHRHRRAPAARGARRDGRLRADDAHAVGAAPGDRGVDHHARRRRRAGARVRPRRTCPRPGPRRCAATRSASTAGSSTPSSPSSTATCTTAASTCRASRSCAGAGIPTCTRSGPGKTETHRALADVHESIAELRYYREHDAAPPDANATTGQARAARAARRGASSPSARAPSGP